MSSEPPPSPHPIDGPSQGPPLALDEVGEGVPLLLLHAFPLSRRMWRPQLAGLAGSCRMLAPDLPGFGASPPLVVPTMNTVKGTGGGAPAAVCRMRDMAAAAVRMLDARGLAAAVICGLSMGGYVALALYEAYRERVLGLVLADTRAANDDEAGRRRRLAAALEVESGGSAVLAHALVPRLVATQTRTARSELVAWLRREIAAAPAAGVAAAQRGMAERPDQSLLLARIAVPTLIVVGEQDEITPPADAAAMWERIPGARLVTIPGAGHLSSLEQPAAFNIALREFLRAFGAGSPDLQPPR